MKRAIAFCRQVGKHWGAFVSGGILIGGLFLWQGSGRPVWPWVFYAIAEIAFLRAAFKAWDEQMDRADKFQQRSKELEGRPDLVLTCELSLMRHPELENISSISGPYSFWVRNSGPGQAVRVSINEITLPMSDSILKSNADMNRAIEQLTGAALTREPESDKSIVKFGTIPSIPEGGEAAIEIKIKNAGRLQETDLYFCMENTVREETLIGTYRHPLILRFSNKDGASWRQMYQLQHTFKGPLTLSYERIEAQ